MSDKTVYARPESMTDRRSHYCPGCGHGILHRLMTELVDELGVRETTIAIAPVGCSVTAYDYFRFDTCEAAHGRAPAVATGIKRTRPECMVIAYQGDGDLASIGMAEIIHAANRGENYTTLFVNNTIYGMTGGQMAPTTLVGQKTATSPAGRDLKTMGAPIRMCELLNTLDRPFFIQRTAIDSPGGIARTRTAMRKAFEYQLAGRGFTFVEVLSACPTYWKQSPFEAMQHISDEITTVFPPGVFRDRGKESHAT